MRFAWTIAAAWLPLELSGCADYMGMPSLEMKLPEIFQQQPAVQTPVKLQKDWWKHTSDKTLLAIIHSLETQNLSLEQARFRLNAARLDTHKIVYLPSLIAKTEAQYDRLLEGNAAIGNNISSLPGGKKTTGYYDAKLDASWEVTIYGQFDDTPLDVLRNRPDIRKAEASVLAAAGEFELSKSDMFPKLTLSGNLSQLDNLTGNPLIRKAVQFTGIPSLSLPLFDWDKRLSVAQIKDEKLPGMASAYHATVIGAMKNVDELWSSYRMARLVGKAAEEGTQIALKASEHASLLFIQGINDGIGAKTAVVDAARAAIIELQARTDSITKLIALTKAFGGAPVPPINEKADA